jgi:hypothetical protein
VLILAALVSLRDDESSIVLGEAADVQLVRSGPGVLTLEGELLFTDPGNPTQYAALSDLLVTVRAFSALNDTVSALSVGSGSIPAMDTAIDLTQLQTYFDVKRSPIAEAACRFRLCWRCVLSDKQQDLFCAVWSS